MRPNILLLFPDQHRGDWLSSRGTLGVRTPTLDALAASGRHYTNAYTPSPLCSPARACLASGRRYDRQSVRANTDDFILDDWNVYRAMRDAGYTVLGCGKFDLLKASMDWGDDGRHGAGTDSRLWRLGFSDGCDSAGKHDCLIAYEREMGGEPYRAFLQSRGLWQAHFDDFSARGYGDHTCYTNVDPTPLPDDAYCDNWIAETGRRLIREAPADRPWFLQVNFNGPHEPLDVTQAMLARWQDVEMPVPIRNTQYPAAEHQQMRRNYAAMIENIDARVGDFLDDLRDTEQLDRTLVVYSSDHGDNLGDHDKWHKTTPHQGSVHVPLIVSGPGVDAVEDATPVDLVDVAATLIEAAGAASPEVPLDGCDLRGGTTREHLWVGFGEWRMITDGRFKYVHNYDPAWRRAERVRMRWTADESAPRRLYDLHEDPTEENDLATSHPAHCRDLAAALFASLDRAPIENSEEHTG